MRLAIYTNHLQFLSCQTRYKHTHRGRNIYVDLCICSFS